MELTSLSLLASLVCIRAYSIDTPIVLPESSDCQYIVDQIGICWQLPTNDSCDEKDDYSSETCTHQFLQEAKEACNGNKESFKIIYESIKLIVGSNRIICTSGLLREISPCWRPNWLQRLMLASNETANCKNILQSLVDEATSICTEPVLMYTNALAEEMNCAQLPTTIDTAIVSTSEIMNHQEEKNSTANLISLNLMVMCLINLIYIF